MGSCHTGKLFPLGRLGSSSSHQGQELGVAQELRISVSHLNFPVPAATDHNGVLSGLLTLTELLVI